MNFIRIARLWAVFINFDPVPCQGVRPSLSEEDMRRGSKKRARWIEMQPYTRKRLHCLWNMGVWMVEAVQDKKYCWKTCPRNFFAETFTGSWPPVRKIKKRNLFVYVQCAIEVPENLKAIFANFPPFSKNSSVSKNDYGDLMKMFVEEEGVMCQPWKMLTSSFTF